MYSQANVRVGKVLGPSVRALPSVIVDTEKVLREADGPVKLVVVRPHTDGKVFAPGCASKAGLVKLARSPKNTSARTTLTDNLFNEIYNKTKPVTRSVRRPRK